MRIRLSGEEGGKYRTYEYNLLDRTEKSSNTLSMARTTGYTCTAAVNLLAEGRFTQKGISPPEYLGEDESNFEFILAYLKARGVNYHVKATA